MRQGGLGNIEDGAPKSACSVVSNWGEEGKTFLNSAGKIQCEMVGWRGRSCKTEIARIDGWAFLNAILDHNLEN